MGWLIPGAEYDERFFFHLGALVKEVFEGILQQIDGIFFIPILHLHLPFGSV